MDISRRDFLKGAAVSAVSITAMSLVGCNSSSAASTPTPKEAEIYAAGTYSASAKGMESVVTVTMTFSSMSIDDVVIDASGETENLGGVAATVMTDQIKDAQTAEVDGYSSATVTSDAIKTAAKDCITQAKAALNGAGEPQTLSYTPGTYQGEGQGRNGIVKLDVTFSEDTITNIEIVESVETEDLKYVPQTILPKTIIAAQSLAVDAISGATMTSSAIKSAVADAATKAGAKASLLYTKDFDLSGIVQSMTPGTYIGEAYGEWKAGDIEGERHGTPAIILPTQVQVTVDAEKILTVEVLDCSDTPGFKEPALEKIPIAIVEQQSVTVDTIAGATMTSAAITSATSKALEQAGADLAGFAKTTPKSSSKETYDCDFLIVGAGTCGTSAALRAVELGLNVIAIEKTARVSGTGACSTGPFAVESDMAKENGVTLTVDKAFVDMMDYAYWKTNAPLVYNVVKNSGQLINWMQDKWEGIGYKGFQAPSGDSINQMHMYGKGTAKFKALWDEHIIPAGGQLLLQTTATDLIMNDGKTAGVHATKADGTKLTINAKAVLLCTGGYGGNRDMMKSILGEGSRFGLVGLSSNQGDGIKMAQSANAIFSEELSPGLAEFCTNDVVDYYHGYMKFTNQAGFLCVDPAGDRFMNEELMLTHSNSMGAAAMRRPGHCYLIYTQENLDSMVENGLWEILGEDLIAEYGLRSRIIVPSYYTLNEEMAKAIEAGQAFKADTLEELGEAAGFSALTWSSTITEYKKVIADGVDPLFGKSRALMHPINNGPFYAVCVTPAIDGTMNAIKIDKKMRALDDNQLPIPGLYVGGLDAGGFFTYPYNEYLGSSSGFALNSGMMTADNVMEYLEL